MKGLALAALAAAIAWPRPAEQRVDPCSIPPPAAAPKPENDFDRNKLTRNQA